MTRFLTSLLAAGMIAIALMVSTSQPVASLQGVPCYEGSFQWCDRLCTTNGRVCVDYFEDPFDMLGVPAFGG